MFRLETSEDKLETSDDKFQTEVERREHYHFHHYFDDVTMLCTCDNLQLKTLLLSLSAVSVFFILNTMFSIFLKFTNSL